MWYVYLLYYCMDYGNIQRNQNSMAKESDNRERSAGAAAADSRLWKNFLVNEKE